VLRGYVITKDIGDFGILGLPSSTATVSALKIPAPLACYWLGRTEIDQAAAE